MKIATAMGDPFLNEKLRKYKKYEVLGRDIQYQDGVIEFLEEIKEINIFIISNQLIEEYDFKILINKILNIKKDIEIIVFLKNKDTDIEQFLNSKKIYKIYYLNNEGYENFFETFIKNVQKNNREINEEINDLKNIILKNNFINIKKDKRSKGEIIIIDGAAGVGKTSICKILSTYIANKNKKVLIVELENYIGNIINKTNCEKNFYFKNLEVNIYSININEYILSEFNIILNKLNILNIYEIENLLEEIRYKFEYIILDFSKEILEKYKKIFLQKSNNIFFLIEGNLLSIMESNNILERYINDYNISNDNIKIIVNKFNKYCMSEREIQEYFYKIFIVLKITYSDKYTLFINSKFKEKIKVEELEKIYRNI